MRFFLKKQFMRFQRTYSTILYPLKKIKHSIMSMNTPRILMYHSISEFPTEFNVPYDNVSPSLFERQMKLLVEEDWNVITLGKFVDLINMKKKIFPKTVIITFDDGFKNNYLYAFPILNKYHLRATFFIVAEFVGDDKFYKHLLWDSASQEYCKKYPETRLPIDWKEVKELHNGAMEIASHGLTHRSIGNLNMTEAEREIVESKEIIEKNISSVVDLLAYPFGSKTYNDYNSSLYKILKKAGYKGACTTEIGFIRNTANLFELPRIPIRENDSELWFKQKLYGAYDWVGSYRRLFQKMANRIDKID